ncbi:MAG: family N-acetyltransferase, partial [Jatrophihabitantaceae bacterium]|nr:family N-acetyltransferase [Jatrophihabitantaceae bacterium]
GGNRTIEVEALAHGARRRQNLVGIEADGGGHARQRSDPTRDRGRACDAEPVSEMAVSVRPIGPGDHDQWAVRFAQYRDFYEYAPNAAVVERVWGWINDAAHETNA